MGERKGKLHAGYTFLDGYKIPPVHLSTNTLLNLYVITITEGHGIALEDHVNVCVRVHTDILKWIPHILPPSERQTVSGEYKRLSAHTWLNLQPALHREHVSNTEGDLNYDSKHTCHQLSAWLPQGVYPACCSCSNFPEFHFSKQASRHVAFWPCILVITPLQLWRYCQTAKCEPNTRKSNEPVWLRNVLK